MYTEAILEDQYGQSRGVLGDWIMAFYSLLEQKLSVHAAVQEAYARRNGAPPDGERQ